MLGGIIVLAVKDITAHAVGIILAVAAGVHIYIGASECIPRVDRQLHGWKDRALGVVMFAVGAISIGLALLNHQHCDGSH
jgi:zinc transporter ZupT